MHCSRVRHCWHAPVAVLQYRPRALPTQSLSLAQVVEHRPPALHVVTPSSQSVSGTHSTQRPALAPVGR